MAFPKRKDQAGCQEKVCKNVPELIGRENLMDRQGVAGQEQGDEKQNGI